MESPVKSEIPLYYIKNENKPKRFNEKIGLRIPSGRESNLLTTKGSTKRTGKNGTLGSCV
jgi:hypothetical protein